MVRVLSSARRKRLASSMPEVRKGSFHLPMSIPRQEHIFVGRYGQPSETSLVPRCFIFLNVVSGCIAIFKEV